MITCHLDVWSYLELSIATTSLLYGQKYVTLTYRGHMCWNTFENNFMAD